MSSDSELLQGVTGRGEFVPYTEEELRVYYSMIFPSKSLAEWFSYGGTRYSDMKYFAKREFAFTLENDVYRRWLSWDTELAFKEQVITDAPAKIHIGAVYNVEPSEKGKVSDFKPEEKELVFDIDANDYDDIRICPCKGTAAVCKVCWGLLDNTIRILDTTLRRDFGFNRLIWVFSGRRGVHCWVCDQNARQLTSEGRSAIASYIAVNLQERPLPAENRLHPSLYRAYKDVLKPYFDEMVEKHQMMNNETAVAVMLKFIKKDQAKLKEALSDPNLDSSKKWEVLCQFVQKKAEFDYEEIVNIIFHFSYPRLDIAVSKQWNHLLKAPLTIHPSTGMICVPITCTTVTERGSFDPTKVPRIHKVCQEVNILTKAHNAKPASILRKTSLGPYLEVLNQFLLGGVQERRQVKAENQDTSF